MHSKLIDRLYLIGMLAAVAWVLAFPTWAGKSYSYDYDHASETGSFNEPNGTFGLDFPNATMQTAPVWSPPDPGSDSFEAVVRMPWETPSHQYHVEIHIASTFSRLFLCSLALGVLHRISIAATRSTPSAIGSIAWSVSMMSIIGCLVLFAIAVFTMGYGLTHQVMMGGMLIPIMAGTLYGVYQHWSNGKPESGEVEKSNTSWSRGLGWYVLGLAIGFPLMEVTNAFVFQFRPRQGFPFGPEDHVGNLMAGGAMLLVAWPIGLALWKRIPVGLRNGFLFSATSLAVMCCIRF